jgi:hypothetical protein
MNRMRTYRRAASLLVLPLVLAAGVLGLARGFRTPTVPSLGKSEVIWSLPDPTRADWGVQPAFGDVVGDERPDLLVGDLQGQLRIYRNVGEGSNHVFATAPTPFHEICDDGRIPTG